MARARNIKPGLFKNEILGVADPLFTLLFEGLWLLADRAGRLEDRPLRIKAEVFPYRDGVSVDDMLTWLQANGFITRYEAKGVRVIQIINFEKHQNPHKNEAPSDLPCHTQCHTSPSERFGAASEEIGSARADSLSTDSLFSDSPISDSRDCPSGSSPRPTIPCPYQSIVDRYHEKLPELPRVKLMTDSRQKVMRKFWGWVLSSTKPSGERRATTAEEAVIWIGDYFARAGGNDFLMGRGDRSGTHANWRADFDFLLTEKGMRQVIEKTEVAA